MAVVINFVPGEQWKPFYIVAKKTTVSAKGRVMYDTTSAPTETFLGAISKATPKEVQQWGQTQRLITHKVVVEGTTTAAEGNVIVFQADNRKFHVQGAKDCGELGIFSVIYCLEKLGDGLYEQSENLECFETFLELLFM